MGKYKHCKAIGLLLISCEALIHTIPKIWEKWIPIARKKYGKTQTFHKFKTGSGTQISLRLP